MKLSQIQGGQFDEFITDSEDYYRFREENSMKLSQIQGGQFDEFITDSGRRIR